jgi:two-component system, NtrC family, sensor histidine kinase PilS
MMNGKTSPLRQTPSSTSEKALKAILDPRRMLRWIYVGRMTVASAIFVAAVLRWFSVDEHTTLLATLALVVSAIITGVSFGYAQAGRPLTRTFLYLQFITDLVLVTIVVHTTGPAGVGGPTTFSALYILVITMAALLLPERSSLLVAALGIVLYFTDIAVFQPELAQDHWMRC